MGRITKKARVARAKRIEDFRVETMEEVIINEKRRQLVDTLKSKAKDYQNVSFSFTLFSLIAFYVSTTVRWKIYVTLILQSRIP